MPSDAVTLARDLARIGGIVHREMLVAMDKITLAVKGKLAETPPETDRNRPGRWREVRGKGSRVYLRPMGFYERHRGSWYPVMRAESLGQTRGLDAGTVAALKMRRRFGQAGTGAVAGYKLIGAPSGTSEFLNQSWNTRITSTTDIVTGVVGSRASYAEQVQGTDETQAALFRRIGWRSLDRALSESDEAIDAAVNEAVDAIVRSL